MVSHNWDEIRSFVWNDVGIVKTHKRLASAKARVENIQEETKAYCWGFLVTQDNIHWRRDTVGFKSAFPS